MEEESSKFGLHISWAKTKVQNLEAGPDAQDLVVNCHTVDGVSELIYLGSKHKQSSHANSSTECVQRIALAAGVTNDLDDVWRQRSLSLHTKFRLYSACVMTVLLHGHSTNACGLRSKHLICDVSAESFQSSGTISFRCYSGRHIWLGQYQHSSCLLLAD